MGSTPSSAHTRTGSNSPTADRGSLVTTTIPLPRTLQIGAKGQDVGAMQRALHRWDETVRPSGPTNVFGGPTMIQVKKFQQASKVPMSGWYGLATHEKLAPHYDDYGALLMQNATAAL